MPGPWFFVVNPSRKRRVHFASVHGGPDEFTVAEVCNHIAVRDEAEANARLIAAAPEMLDALKHVAGYAMAGGKSFGDLPIVKAAIAKAEGRQP